MHVIFISACEKKALKKTRAVLDSYAIRTGQSTWQAPMTMEGLTEVRNALKQKGITRQTAVAAYINYGMRRMKLAWVVGAKHRFNSEGAYPVASTGKPYTKRQIDDWARAASLLAGAAGDMHDIGKASQHFQNKLSPNQANKIIADDIRHEWLSVKLLQQLRHNNFDWQDAWQQVAKDKNRNIFTLGDLKQVDDGVANGIEAVDYLIVTHHGLLGADDPTANDTIRQAFSLYYKGLDYYIPNKLPKDKLFQPALLAWADLVNQGIATTEKDLNNQDWKNKGIEATSTNMDSREVEQQFLTHILRIVLAQGREAKNSLEQVADRLPNITKISNEAYDENTGEMVSKEMVALTPLQHPSVDLAIQGLIDTQLRDEGWMTVFAEHLAKSIVRQSYEVEGQSNPVAFVLEDSIIPFLARRIRGLLYDLQELAS
jgi:hypothetical protein